jgi:F0F1-type ATP synthase assembly protein I
MRGLTLWQAVAISTQLGIALAVSVFVGLGLGWLVDSWTHVGVIAWLIGALLGLVAGTVSIVQLAQAMVRPDKSTGPNQHPAGPDNQTE